MNYFGNNLDYKAYEQRALKVDPIHRMNEATLVHTRWFDYSLLLPAQATYLFAHHYKLQTQNFIESFIDIRDVEKHRAFTPDDIFMSRDMTSMWLARRAVDAMGIPYDFAMRFGQERAISRMYHRMPRPNQLYGEEYELDLQDAWNASMNHSLRYAKSARFKASAWKSAPVQKLHLDFVVGQIKRRASPHHNLLGRMIHEDVLTPELIESHFSASTIESAIKSARLLK